MIQTLVHTWRGWGCSIFIETNVKRQSNPLPFKACSIQQCTEHIQPSTIISKYDSKKCVHFGTTARKIRVLTLIVIMMPVYLLTYILFSIYSIYCIQRYFCMYGYMPEIYNLFFIYYSYYSKNPSRMGCRITMCSPLNSGGGLHACLCEIEG